MTQNCTHGANSNCIHLCVSTNSWIFIGRTVAEIEVPIFWSPDAKSWVIGKEPDAGEDWKQEEKEGAEEDSMGTNMSKGQEIVGDRGAWWAPFHGVTRSWTKVSERTTIWVMLDTCRHVNPMITSHINAQCGLRMIWNHVFCKAYQTYLMFLISHHKFWLLSNYSSRKQLL